VGRLGRALLPRKGGWGRGGGADGSAGILLGRCGGACVFAVVSCESAEG
jgi:hypothetical protein